MRTLPWMILAKGLKPRGRLDAYAPMVTFARWVQAEDARTMSNAIKKEFPNLNLLCTNREDWNRCYNTR